MRSAQRGAIRIAERSRGFVDGAVLKLFERCMAQTFVEYLLKRRRLGGEPAPQRSNAQPER